MPFSRRQFLTAASGAIAFRDETLSRLGQLDLSRAGPEEDDFWLELREQFDLHPELTLFNNAGLSPSPRSVRAAVEAQTRRADAGPSYVIWRQQDPELEAVRQRLAGLVGCSPEELALTMNATYGLQTAILGIPLGAGDEILTTAHDYPRTFTAIAQRARRDGAVLVEVPLGTPPDDPALIVQSILDRVTARTRLVVISQVTYLTGQILPAQQVGAALAPLGIPLLVDAAHGIGLLPDTLAELGASLYTACLHKWLMGPVGTGVFVVRSDWIDKVWPLHPADELLDRRASKFEQTGTRPAAPLLALGEALDFHEMLGLERKAARLEALRKRLAERVLAAPGVVHHGSLQSDRCRAILTVGLEQAPTRELAAWLLKEHRIHVTTVTQGGVDGIRISPNVFTTQAEIDRLCTALETAASKGLENPENPRHPLP